MERKAVSGIMLTLLLVGMLTLAFNIRTVRACPKTIYVDAKNVCDPFEDGTQEHPFDKIQEGVNVADPEDTIYIYNGTYYEGVTISKPLKLIGQNQSNTIVNASETAPTVVSIDSNNVTVSGFTMKGGYASGWYFIGIVLWYSSGCNISGNIIIDNVDDGIYFPMSSGNIFSNNIIANNGGDGIYTGFYSSKNIITGNTIANNSGYGIRLDYSSDNIIFHNNFINNTVQAYNYGGSINVWDDGYPSGGNYWSDYTGIDDKSGPNQDQLGSDGIGDTPYIIDANNLDRYPLISPRTRISRNLQILEPIDGSVIMGPATIAFVIENTGEDVEFLQGDPTNRIDLEIEHRSSGGEIYGWGIMFWSTSYYGLTLSSGEKHEQTLVYDPSKYEGSVPPGFIGEAPYGEGTIRLVHWKSLEPGYWDIGEFGKAEIQVIFQKPPIAASIDFEPETLNLKSKGKWITAYIELPEGYNVSDTDVSTIMLNGTIPISLLNVPALEPVPTEIGDYDEDGIPDLMVKFDRATVESFIYNQGIRYRNVALTITGELFDGNSFEGTDILFVNYAGDANNDGIINVLDAGVVSAHWHPGPPTGPLGYISDADFNKDGAVDILDAGILSVNWGQTVPPTTP